MSTLSTVHAPPIIIDRIRAFHSANARENTRIAIVSAGALTRSLLAKRAFNGLSVVAVIDRGAPQHPEGIEGVPVLTYDALETLCVDAILVASTRYHLEMMTQLGQVAARRNIPLIDLCAGVASDGELAVALSRLEKVHTLLCAAEVRALLSEPRYSDRRRLEHFGFRCYSQHDEDGIIHEILRRLGERAPRTFVEFGVGDGMENNTLFLLKQGWRGVWLEGSEESANLISARFDRYIESGQLFFRRAMVSRDNVNDVIGEGLRGKIGVLSIDIDGNDYWVWKAIDVVSPALVVVEYNGKFPPPIRWTIEYDPHHSWDLTDYQGASLVALAELGREKGYRLVGCNINGTNAFLLREDLVDEQFVSSDDPAEFYHPARYYLTEGYQWMSGHAPDPRPGRFW
jgi:hypothetical protein